MAPIHLLPRAVYLVGEAVDRRPHACAPYRISPGSDWWEDATTAETLAAVAAWVARYDSGEWDDPPGKLALLYDIERVRALVRGSEPFDPRRDYGVFCRFLVETGCQPPINSGTGKPNTSA